MNPSTLLLASVVGMLLGCNAPPGSDSSGTIRQASGAGKTGDVDADADVDVDADPDDDGGEH